MAALQRATDSAAPVRGAAAGVRGPLNQVLCGSVNRVNVTHFVENYTSTRGELWAYMVSLINLDLVMAV